MKITKNQLQQLIREEYVRTVLESRGYAATPQQVRVLAENLDEGIFGALGKAFKSGKEAYKQARGEDQEKLNFEAEVKTQDQLKKELVTLRMKAKDKLKSNGYVGDESDVSVLGIDLFEAAVKEVMGESHSGKTAPRAVEKDVRAGMGSYRAR